MAGITKYYNHKGGLHIRAYAEPDGSEHGRTWIWRPYFDGKARELVLGPVAHMPEALARHLVDACKARRKAGYGFQEIAEEVAETLIVIADQNLADHVAEARQMPPFAGARFEHAARQQHANWRELAEALAPEGGA